MISWLPFPTTYPRNMSPVGLVLKFYKYVTVLEGETSSYCDSSPNNVNLVQMCTTIQTEASIAEVCKWDRRSFLWYREYNSFLQNGQQRAQKYCTMKDKRLICENTIFCRAIIASITRGRLKQFRSACKN